MLLKTRLLTKHIIQKTWKWFISKNNISVYSYWRVNLLGHKVLLVNVIQQNQPHFVIVKIPWNRNRTVNAMYVFMYVCLGGKYWFVDQWCNDITIDNVIDLFFSGQTQVLLLIDASSNSHRPIPAMTSENVCAEKILVQWYGLQTLLNWKESSLIIE